MPVEQLELECPRCRQPTVDGRSRVGLGRRNGNCPLCGMRMVPSVRRSEDEAWQRLYGGRPRGLS